MATIHKTSDSIINATDFNGIQALVDNYWGNADNEKIFSVPFWKMQELMAVSGEVALRVREIGNTSYVNAEWIVFEDDMEGLLNDPVRAREIYFVLDETTFLQLRANISTLTNPLGTVAIWGRLGKLAATGTEYRFFVVAAAGTPIPPGTGGGGATGGVKIPST